MMNDKIDEKVQLTLHMQPHKPWTIFTVVDGLGEEEIFSGSLDLLIWIRWTFNFGKESIRNYIITVKFDIDLEEIDSTMS